MGAVSRLHRILLSCLVRNSLNRWSLQVVGSCGKGQGWFSLPWARNKSCLCNSCSDIHHPFPSVWERDFLSVRMLTIFIQISRMNYSTILPSLNLTLFFCIFYKYFHGCPSLHNEKIDQGIGHRHAPLPWAFGRGSTCPTQEAVWWSDFPSMYSVTCSL